MNEAVLGLNNWGIVFQPPTMRNKTNGSIRTPRDSVRSFQVLTGKGPGSRGVLLHQVSLTSVENMRVICQSIPIAAHDDLWGPLLGFTCITSGRLFVRSMLKSRLGSLPWSTVRPLLPCCRVRNPSGPSRDCFGCGRSHPLGTSTTSWPLRAPAP